MKQFWIIGLTCGILIGALIFYKLSEKIVSVNITKIIHAKANQLSEKEEGAKQLKQQLNDFAQKHKVILMKNVVSGVPDWTEKFLEESK